MVREQRRRGGEEERRRGGEEERRRGGERLTVVGKTFFSFT
jgi:hypothetical protein